MKKILPLLVVSILILSGLGAVAIPSYKIIENKTSNMQDFELEIVIEGGLFGYLINVINKGTEPVSGNLSIEISTTAMITLIGRNLSKEYELGKIDPGSAKAELKLRYFLGFGDATMSISGVFRTDQEEYPFGSTNERGYIFLIYVVFGDVVFNFP